MGGRVAIDRKIIKSARADLESLYRIFTIPESEHSTLGSIEKEISVNLNGFLRELMVAKEISPHEIERSFSETTIPDQPVFVSEQADFLLNQVVSRSVHTSSPSFVGHMTSALPYFMLPLAKVMIALNQNLVKIETSKAFTPLERQVLGMLHRLVFNFDESFYSRNTQQSSCALGSFCSDGTIANITALWVALNLLLPKSKSFGGVGDEGLAAALKQYGYQDVKVLVSRRGHYSLKKAANLLGIGRNNLVQVDTDDQNKIKLGDLINRIDAEKQAGNAIVAVVGVAGTTETGNVDPLDTMAEICQEHGIHFHVDAAWGGPTLFSDKYKSLLKGIEQADSVTIDAHKQLYVPVGAGICLFKSESSLSVIEHQAEYIIRRGSRDLGRTSLEGSRPGMAMLVHSGLRIIGKKGYEILIDLGIEKARLFAKMIEDHSEFELISRPELNLLTYRYVPLDVKEKLAIADDETNAKLNSHLNWLTTSIQKEQREEGRTFVSRTSLHPIKYRGHIVTVFRVVLANPLTTEDTLKEILKEQKEIAKKLIADDIPTRTK